MQMKRHYDAGQKTPPCRSQRPHRFSLSPGAARPADTSPLPTSQPPIYYGYMERPRGLGQVSSIGPESRGNQWTLFGQPPPLALPRPLPCPSGLHGAKWKNEPQYLSPGARPAPRKCNKMHQNATDFFSRRSDLEVQSHRVWVDPFTPPSGMPAPDPAREPAALRQVALRWRRSRKKQSKPPSPVPPGIGLTVQWEFDPTGTHAVGPRQAGVVNRQFRE